MKIRTPGTRFSVARELRKNFNHFPTKALSKISTEEYVKLYCTMNPYIKSKYIINSREVIA